MKPTTLVNYIIRYFILVGMILFGFASCSIVPVSVKTDIELAAVQKDRSETDSGLRVFSSGSSNTYRFEDDLLNITVTFKSHSIDIEAINRMDKVLRLVWDDMYIVDSNNQAFPVAKPDDSFLGLAKSKSIRVLPPGAITSFRLRISSSGNLGISRPLFVFSRHNKEKARLKARESIGKSLKVNLAFEDNEGQIHSYLLTGVLKSVRINGESYN